MSLRIASTVRTHARALLRRACAFVAVFGLSLVLVWQGAFGISAALAAGPAPVIQLFSEEEAAPSAAEMLSAAVCAESVICGVAVGIGAILVASGVVFYSSYQATQAIQTVWNSLSASEGDSLVQNFQSNGMFANVPISEVDGWVSTLQSAANAGSWSIVQSDGTARVGDYLSTSTGSSFPGAAETITFALSSNMVVPQGDSVHVWSSAGQGAQPAVLQVVNGAVHLASAPYSVGCSGPITGGSGGGQGTGATYGVEICSGVTSSTSAETITISYTGNQAYPFAFGDAQSNGIEIDVSELGSPYNGYTFYAYPDQSNAWASAALTGWGAPSLPNGLLPTPPEVQVPTDAGQLVGAGPTTQVTTRSGQQLPLSNGSQTGELGILGSIYSWLTVGLPQWLNNLVVPDATSEQLIEARISSIDNSLVALPPILAVTTFLSDLNSYLTSAGSGSCPQVQWSFSLFGNTWNYDVPFCDTLGVLSAVRTFEGWVVYGAMTFFLFDRVRRWWQSGRIW